MELVLALLTSHQLIVQRQSCQFGFLLRGKFDPALGESDIFATSSALLARASDRRVFLLEIYPFNFKSL